MSKYTKFLNISKVPDKLFGGKAARLEKKPRSGTSSAWRIWKVLCTWIPDKPCKRWHPNFVFFLTIPWQSTHLPIWNCNSKDSFFLSPAALIPRSNCQSRLSLILKVWRSLQRFWKIIADQRKVVLFVDTENKGRLDTDRGSKRWVAYLLGADSLRRSRSKLVRRKWPKWLTPKWISNPLLVTAWSFVGM